MDTVEGLVQTIRDVGTIATVAAGVVATCGVATIKAWRKFNRYLEANKEATRCAAEKVESVTTAQTESLTKVISEAVGTEGDGSLRSVVEAQGRAMEADKVERARFRLDVLTITDAIQNHQVKLATQVDDLAKLVRVLTEKRSQ